MVKIYESILPSKSGVSPLLDIAERALVLLFLVYYLAQYQFDNERAKKISSYIYIQFYSIRLHATTRFNTSR